jgi:hypothetical protein
LQKRPTAVVVIYSASILHIVEAFILAESKAADTSIPIASLLDAQAYCERRDFRVQTRWLYTGGDLSRPITAINAPSARSCALSACRDAHCRLPTSPVHTSRSLPGSVASTIKVGADIKSP